MKNNYSQEEATLLVFCKQPRLSQGKQRIAATLGVQTAFEIASAMLDCTLEDAEKWQGRVVLSPAGADEIEWAKSLLQQAEVVAQPEGNLGQRIGVVDQQLRDRGHQKIIIIGTDAPVLTDNIFNQALDALNHNDIVFSAAEDGGVTLMGANVPWPRMTDLPWSTDRLSEGLHNRCTEAGLSIAYIQPSYDIDHEKDLHKLIVDLTTDARASRQSLLSLVRPIVYKDKIEVTG